MIRFLLFGCICLLSHIATAQEVVFVARAAAKQVGLQDPFEVQFSLQNVRNITSFDLPTLKGVQILSGPSKNIQYREINGRRTLQIDLTYVMKARKLGPLTIGSATASADGHTFHANEIQLDVVQGSVIQARKKQAPKANTYDPFDALWGDDPLFDEAFEAMRQHQEHMMKRWQQQAAPREREARVDPVHPKDIHKHIFFVVETDKRNVYRGEQINVSYKLYTRLPMEITITKTPDLQGFWSQDVKLPSPPHPQKEIYKGKEYQVFEIKRTAIFPTKTGELMLDPAKAEGVVRLMSEQGNADWFDAYFGSLLLDDQDLQRIGGMFREVPIQLASEPIQIHVEDVPQVSKPGSFQGAVGQFNLEANIDKTEMRLNESATLTLRIRGRGNLKLAAIPEVKFPDSLTAYEPQWHDSSMHTPQGICGYREIRYLFSPNKAGRIQIPATQFSYFDPESKEYKTVESKPYTLLVYPDKAMAQNGKNPIRDFHDIVTTPMQLRQHQPPVFLTRPEYWVAYAVPLLALLTLLAYRRKQAAPDTQRTINTLPESQGIHSKPINPTGTMEILLRQGEPSAFYRETIRVLWNEIDRRWHTAYNQLTHEAAVHQLQVKGMPEHLQHELFRLTQLCESALYSPDKGIMRMQQVYSDTLHFLAQLEKTL